jgi:winged helix-turn helix protein
MTRREVITKAIDGQLSWVAAADIIGVTPRQMRRIRRAIERHGMSAVMDQRGGRPRRKRVTADPRQLDLPAYCLSKKCYSDRTSPTIDIASFPRPVLWSAHIIAPYRCLWAALPVPCVALMLGKRNRFPDA